MKVASIVWLLAGLGLAFTAELAWEHLWIAAMVPLIIWALLGVVLLVMAGLRLRYPEQRRTAGAVLMAVTVGALAFLPTARLGASVTPRVRYALHRAGYQRVVAMVRDSAPSGGLHELHGLRYVVDPGPPVRVAFPWPGGVIDNWCGVIFDPTKLVLQANNFTGDWSRWHDQVPIEVIRLFGGDLVHCNEIEATFYHCCFT